MSIINNGSIEWGITGIIRKINEKADKNDRMEKP